MTQQKEPSEMDGSSGFFGSVRYAVRARRRQA
jgi:hypothetical protein